MSVDGFFYVNQLAPQPVHENMALSDFLRFSISCCCCNQHRITIIIDNSTTRQWCIAYSPQHPLHEGLVESWRLHSRDVRPHTTARPSQDAL